MIKLRRKGIFKENTYQKIIIKADSDQKIIQIEQEYFKTKSINEIKMNYDEYVKMDKLVHECVNNSLKEQYESDYNNVVFGMGPHLIDDEKRIVIITDTKSRNLSVQITNKHVVNVIETLKKENQSFILRINFEELRRIFTRLYYFFNVLTKKEQQSRLN